MKAIWKYQIPVKDDFVRTPVYAFVLSIPEDAQLLTVQMQRGVPCLWALVETENPRRSMSFRIYGTGWPIVEGAAAAEYIGTFQASDGALMWHLFGEPR